MCLNFRREHNFSRFLCKSTKNCTICRAITHFLKKQKQCVTWRIFIQFCRRNLHTPPQVIQKRHWSNISAVTITISLAWNNFSESSPLLIRLSIWLRSYHEGGMKRRSFDISAMHSNKTSFINLGIRLQGKNENNFHVCMTSNNWLLISFRSRLLFAVHVAFRRSCLS